MRRVYYRRKRSINALNHAGAGSRESQVFLEQVYKQTLLVFSPTLLYVEVAITIARVFDNPALGIALAKTIRLLPGQEWVLLDGKLAAEAGWIGAERRLQGEDAVYAAVASLSEEPRSKLRGIFKGKSHMGTATPKPPLAIQSGFAALRPCGVCASTAWFRC